MTTKKRCVVNQKPKITIDKLPDILMCKAFSHLCMDDMFNGVLLTCKHWLDLFNNKQSWQKLTFYTNTMNRYEVLLSKFKVTNTSTTIPLHNFKTRYTMPDFSLVEELEYETEGPIELGDLPRLKRLTFYNSIGDDITDYISISNLLNIVDLGISTYSRLRLPILPKLKILSLCECSIEEILFTKEIIHLTMYNCDCTSASPETINSFQLYHKNLQEFAFDGEGLIDDIANFNFPNLENLNLRLLESRHLTMFKSNLPKLSTLRVTINKYNVLPLVDINKIRYLHIVIENDECFEIPSMPQLLNISVEHEKCTIIFKGEFPMLKNMAVVVGEIKYDNFSAPNLEVFKSNNKIISDKNTVEILSRCKLSQLVYNHGIDYVSVVPKLPHLKILYFNDWGIIRAGNYLDILKSKSEYFINKLIQNMELSIVVDSIGNLGNVLVIGGTSWYLDGKFLVFRIGNTLVYLREYLMEIVKMEIGNVTIYSKREFNRINDQSIDDIL